MKGEKAQPIETKQAKGTLRKSRVSPSHPDRVAGAPQMPATLSPGARIAWAEYSQVLALRGQLSVDSWPALALLCETHAEIAALREDIAENGRFQTVTTKAGGEMERVRPAYRSLMDASRRLLSLLAEFGLTDASRGKVATGIPNPIKSTDDGARDPDDEFGV